jgi:hypothetical protein
MKWPGSCGKMRPVGFQCFGSVERRLRLVGQLSIAPYSACLQLLSFTGFNAYK